MPRTQTFEASSPPDGNDWRLVSEVLRKDRKATAEFVSRCADWIYPFVYRRLTDTSAGPQPLGLGTHPARPILYAGLTSSNQLGVYTFDSTGHLSFVRSVPNSGMAICWIRSNATGTRLYTANTGDNSSVYDSSSPLEPVEIEQLKLKGMGNAFQITLDPRGSFLYVVTQRAGSSIPPGKGITLHVLRIDPITGKVVEEGDSFLELSLPAGTRPHGVAAVELVGTSR